VVFLDAIVVKVRRQHDGPDLGQTLTRRSSYGQKDMSALGTDLSDTRKRAEVIIRVRAWLMCAAFRKMVVAEMIDG